MIPLHQTEAVLAVAILATDRKTDGVLLKGPSGIGKSILMMEFARHVHSIRVPLGSEMEALTGSVDMGVLLTDGRVVRKDGLLDGCVDSVLLVEHLDLFTDDIQDLIMSCGNPVLATISGGEDLRDGLLDRFGLCVQMRPLMEPEKRLSILEAHFTGMKTENPLTRVESSSKGLGRVKIPGWFIKACSFTCSSLKITGHRADTILFRSAVACAALSESNSVERKHLLAVAPLVLGHRSIGSPGIFPDSREIVKAVNFACEMARRGEKDIVSGRMQELTEKILTQIQKSMAGSSSPVGIKGLDFSDKKAGVLGKLSESMRNKFFHEVKTFSSKRGSSGAASSRESSRMQADPHSGRPIRPEQTESLHDMNPILSVKAAAMDGGRLPVVPLCKQYWKKWQRVARPRVVCMLAIDGSRSSQDYLGDLGHILDGLFNRVFDRSSRVGLAVIKNGRAVIQFSPARNRLRVFGRLNDLIPGGETPLDELLSLAGNELRRSGKTSTEQKFIILLSDCFPEPVPVGDIWNSAIYGRVRRQAVNLGRQGIPVMVIDPLQINSVMAKTSPGRRLGRFIAHTTGGKLVCFAKESSYDIFGALKDSALKPKLVSLGEQDELPGYGQAAKGSSLGSLFRQMGSM